MCFGKKFVTIGAEEKLLHISPDRENPDWLGMRAGASVREIGKCGGLAVVSEEWFADFVCMARVERMASTG